MISQIHFRHQKFSGFHFFEFKFLKRDGTELGCIQNKKMSEVKNLQKLGQKTRDKPIKETEEIRDNEVIIGVNIGLSASNSVQSI